MVVNTREIPETENQLWIHHQLCRLLTRTSGPAGPLSTYVLTQVIYGSSISSTRTEAQPYPAMGIENKTELHMA